MVSNLIDDENINWANSQYTVRDITSQIRELATTAKSAYSDGWTACGCKHQLYLLKCLIEDIYKDLPEFPEEEKRWEQERMMELLKK
jgi:hypothetical protein